MTSYTVWKLGSRNEGKHTRQTISINTITQHCLRPVRNNAYTEHITDGVPENTSVPVSPSVLSSQSVGSMKQPGISSLSSQFLILETKNCQPALNEGNRVSGLTLDRPISHKPRRHSGSMRRCTVGQRVQGPAFLKPGAITMNPCNHSLNHLVIYCPSAVWFSSTNSCWMLTLTWKIRSTSIL
jgi:hypothetical protein